MRRIALLIGIAWLGTACDTMKLRDLDQDMPLPLVERYAQSTSDYADKTFLWLPLVFSLEEHVACTERGFQAARSGSFGPLGCLVSFDGSSRFDAHGVLREYARDDTVLWGLLTTTRRHDAETTRGKRTALARSFLFGLLGFAQAIDGTQTLTFLFLPIPWRSGDPDIRIANPEPDDATQRESGSASK